MYRQKYRKQLWNLLCSVSGSDAVHRRAIAESIPLLEKHLKRIMNNKRFKYRKHPTCIDPTVCYEEFRTPYILFYYYFPFSPTFMELTEGIRTQNYEMVCEAILEFVYEDWISDPNVCYALISRLKESISQSIKESKHEKKKM